MAEFLEIILYYLVYIISWASAGFFPDFFLGEGEIFPGGGVRGQKHTICQKHLKRYYFRPKKVEKHTILA
jgi:hypothetical protein